MVAIGFHLVSMSKVRTARFSVSGGPMHCLSGVGIWYSHPARGPVGVFPRPLPSVFATAGATQCPPRRVQKYRDPVTCPRPQNVPCQTRNLPPKTQRKPAQIHQPSPAPDVSPLVTRSVAGGGERKHPSSAQLQRTRLHTVDRTNPRALHCPHGTRSSDLVRPLPKPTCQLLLPNFPCKRHHLNRINPDKVLRRLWTT